MIAYLWYTLKASACLIVLYSFYSLFLRKSTFFILNRLYLVGGLLLSLIIPILKISFLKEQANLVLPTEINKILLSPEYDFFKPQNLSYELKSINYTAILSVMYFTGIAVLFFKLVFSIIKINRIKGSSDVSRIGKIKVFKTDRVVPFSFFNMIFLPGSESNSLIIQHEMEHIKQFHWVDLIIAETVTALLWFNPFVVLYKRALKLQHEYLADYKVIDNSNQIENYLGCMLKHIQVVSSGRLISHFYCKTIKKRIIMITKNKTSVKYLGVYLLALPLLGMLLFAFTGINNKSSRVSSSHKAISSEDEYVPSICPVDITKITGTSAYGNRINPTTKKKDFHYAIDFAAPEGEKVMVTANGIVAEAEYNKTGMGNYVMIKHNGIYSTFYSHLKSISVKAGEKVNRGQVIGLIGSTGLSTGPHLHYEVIKNGARVNPKDYMLK